MPGEECANDSHHDTCRRPARSSTAAATRPSRSMSCSPSGAHGPRRRALGRLHRRARGRRTARRRQGPLRRQGRPQGGRRPSTARSPTRSRHDAADQVAIDRSLIAARRHRQQGPARRQRHPRRLARRAPRRPRKTRACRSTATWAASQARVLPVPMMNVINGGAHADNPIDFQEFMVMPVGAPTFSRGACAWAPRCSTASRRRSRTPATTRTSATRAASPRTAHHRRGARLPGARRSRAAGFRPGEDIVLALDCGHDEFFENGRYVLAGEGRTLRCGGHGATLRGAGAADTRSSRSRTAWPRTTGTAGRR